MSFTRVNRPPQDLSSFIGRKWLETLSAQNDDLNSIINLPFLLTTPSSLLANSRGLAVSPAITLTDGGAGSSLTIGLAYNTTNLKLTASQINTIQDIATTSSPTFTNLTLSGSLSLADITVSNSLRLNNDKKFYFGTTSIDSYVSPDTSSPGLEGIYFNATDAVLASMFFTATTNLNFIGGVVNLYEPLNANGFAATSTGVIFTAEGGFTYNNSANTPSRLLYLDNTNKVVSAATIAGNYQFDGTAIWDLTSTIAFTIRRNASGGNLLVADTTNRTLTIGDATGGDILFNTDVIGSIGSATKRPKTIHIGGATTGAINATARGLKLSGANADYYIGDDNITPGYYSQRSVPSGSTSSDYSTDYSNLYQGDSGYKYLALNYGVTRSIGSNGVVIGDNNTGEGSSLIIGTSTTRRMEMYLDYANKTFVMDGSIGGVGTNKCMKVKLELGVTAPAFYPATDNKIDFGISATNRWKDYYGMTATLSTSLTLSAMTAGSVIYAGTAGLLSQDNANFFWDGTNHRLGIITTAPSNAISLGGEAARVIAMERRTTANTAGNILTIQAGGATSGATNKAGGNLILAAGNSTGSSVGGSIQFQTAAFGTAGTGTNASTTRMTIAAATGAITINQSAATGNITGTTQSVVATSLGAGGIFAGQNWSYSASNVVDTEIDGLVMQLSGSIGATDTGLSVINGFSFQIFESGPLGGGTTGAPANAVLGFIRHSSTVVGLTYVGIEADIQADTGCGAGNFRIFSTSSSIIAGPITSWAGYYVANPGGAIAGGSITNSYGLYCEALTGATNNWAIYAAGGQSAHAGNLKLGDTTAPTEQLEFADAKNIKFQTTTGTKIGTATSQKLAFHNSTPVIQRAGAAQAAVATTASTNITPYGYSTSAQADAIITLLNEIRATLVEKGLMKGSA